MRTLVIVESMFGNTRHVADAVARGLASYGPVDVVGVREAPSAVPEDVGLLVVGGPTHAFGMTRTSTRQDAVRQGARYGAEDAGIREWLEALPQASSGPQAVVFDTRVEKARWLPGSAARGAAKVLRKHGYRILVDPESFWVEDTSGPLIEAELERAQTWGDRIGKAASIA